MLSISASPWLLLAQKLLLLRSPGVRHTSQSFHSTRQSSVIKPDLVVCESATSLLPWLWGPYGKQWNLIHLHLPSTKHRVWWVVDSCWMQMHKHIWVMQVFLHLQKAQSFKKLFLLVWEKGREGESENETSIWERNTDQLPLACTPTGIKSTTFQCIRIATWPGQENSHF